MLKITEYEGPWYTTPKDKVVGDNRWIRFEWSTGYLDMKKYHWEKLSKKKKALILSAR